MSYKAFDLFNRADNASLGSDWDDGSIGTHQIISNKARRNTTDGVYGWSVSVNLTDMGSKNHYAQASWKEDSYMGGGLLVRAKSDLSEGYVVQLRSSGTDAYVYVIRNNAIDLTYYLSNTSDVGTFLETDIWTCVVETNGNQVDFKLYKNGAYKFTMSDTNANRLDGADNRYCGIFCNGANVEVDNWQAGVVANTQNTELTDNFDRDNSATTLGEKWIQKAGVMGISSNKAYIVSHPGTDPNLAIVIHGAKLSSIAHYVQAKILNGAGLVVRSNHTQTSFYVLQVYNDAMYIYRYENGGLTNVTDSDVFTGRSNGDLIRVEVKTNGNKVDFVFKKNGVDWGTTLSDTSASRLTSASYNMVGFADNTDNNTYEDFEAGNLETFAIPTSIKKFIGMTQATVKKTHGLAITSVKKLAGVANT